MDKAVQRKVIGDPKSGLALRIRQTPSQMSLSGRPDALLLFSVIAAAILFGILGAVALSPGAGVVSFVTFAMLLSPLIAVLVFNALRVKTLCVFDRDEGVLHIDERSYTRRIQEVYPLEEVESVSVRRLPSTPLAGGASSYGLFVGLREADYLAACSNNEGTVGQDAWRLSRFLGVPLNASPVEEGEQERPRPRHIVMAVLLYLIPTIVAISVLVWIFDQVPGIEPAFAGLLSAVAISEIAAILAFLYYRTRRPYES